MLTKESLIYAGSNERETSLFKIRDHIENFSKELSAKQMEWKIKKLELESCVKKEIQIKQQKKDIQNQNRDNTESIISFQKDIEQFEKDIVRLLENRKRNDKKIEGYNQEKQNLLKYEEACHQEIQGFDEVISIKEARVQSLSSSRDEYKSYNIKEAKWEKELLENTKDQQSLDQEVSLLLDVVHQSRSMTQENRPESAFIRKKFKLGGGIFAY